MKTKTSMNDLEPGDIFYFDGFAKGRIRMQFIGMNISYVDNILVCKAMDLETKEIHKFYANWDIELI